MCRLFMVCRIDRVCMSRGISGKPEFRHDAKVGGGVGLPDAHRITLFPKHSRVDMPEQFVG